MTTSAPPTSESAPLWKLGAALFALYVIWGSTYFGIRIALVDLPPMGFAAMRFLVAGGLLYAFFRMRGTPRPTRVQWRNGVLIGFLLLAMGNGAVVLAQQTVSSSLAAVMVATMPLFAGLWAGLAGERASRAEWLGLVIGFIGVAMLSGEGDLQASPLGAILLVLAPASWALGSVLSPRLPLAPGFMGSAVQMLGGGAIMLVAAVVRGESWPSRIGMPSLLAWLYLVVFGSILAFSAYGFLLRHVRTTVATSYAYVNPVVAIALGVGLGNEVLGIRGLAGAALVLAAVVLVTLGRGRRPVPRSTHVGPQPVDGRMPVE